MEVRTLAELAVNQNYKDGLFLMIFRNKQSLLSLYNAVRGSNYTNPDDLTVTTIENVLYMGMKNDVSFIINNQLHLYEAQSTWNPNMPLRGLFYFSDVYQGYIAEHELNIYGTKRIDLPTPNYIVFYNGTANEPDSKTLRLSDSFINPNGEEACLECSATMVNINFGHNQQLMDACHELYEYSYLVEQVRIGTRSGLALPDAIDQAVIHCIEHHILENFLRHHRAEVTNMILKEFNLEEHIKSEKAYSYAEGHAEGRSAERNAFSLLTQKLFADSRIENLKKAAENPEYMEQLMKEYHII